MRRHGQWQFVGGDAMAVVDHAHKFNATLGNGHINPRGASIDGVFQQLLHHAGRPLNHLAGGNFIDDARR